MTLLFNLIYLFGFLVSLPWVVASRLVSKKSFRSWPIKFFGSVPQRNSENPCLWFHAVSVGEVNLIHTVIDRFQKRYPDHDIVVSSTTDTGFDLAQSKFKNLSVFYFPWDFSWSIKNAFRRIRPDVLVLAELEIWPNLIHLAKSNSIDVAVINGRLSEKSLRGYKKLPRLSKLVFQSLDLVAAQNQTYANRFRELGTKHENTFVTGSIKFDGASMDRKTAAICRLKNLAQIKSEQTVILAGSTQNGEDEFAVKAFLAARQASPHLRLMIAPRHPHRAAAIAKLVIEAGLNPVLRSRLDPNGHQSNSRPAMTSDDVVIIDSIGELGDWWGTAQIAFVGGSLGDRGGQNMIEPAARGCAVCFGPNTKNFRDVVELMLESDAARVVRNELEMADFLDWVMSHNGESAQMAVRGVRLVETQKGATDQTLRLLANLMETAVQPRVRAA